jgi:hypothetical protein
MRPNEDLSAVEIVRRKDPREMERREGQKEYKLKE